MVLHKRSGSRVGGATMSTSTASQPILRIISKFIISGTKCIRTPFGAKYLRLELLATTGSYKNKKFFVHLPMRGDGVRKYITFFEEIGLEVRLENYNFLHRRSFLGLIPEYQGPDGIHDIIVIQSGQVYEK